VSKHIKIGDSVEGENLQITTRSFIAQGTLNINGIGLCYKGLCKRNAASEILIENIDKRAIYLKNAFLLKGDRIEGQSIETFSKNLLKEIVVSNYSSVHGIKKFETKKYGASTIRIPFRPHLNNSFQPKITD
jgi:hypothetical protein